AMVLMFVRVSMSNYREYGSILGSNQIMKMMFSHDVFVLGITDGVMCGSAILEGYLLQNLVQKGYINWAKGGWIIQNVWQTLYLGAVVGWAYFREWPWTHTIFAVLHGLVFLMKQHSYGFYNGYLSGVYRRRRLLERRLKNLQAMEPVHSAHTSPRNSQQIDAASSGVDFAKLPHHSPRTGSFADAAPKRRPSMGHRTSTNLTVEQSDVASVAQAIESGRSIDLGQMKTFESVIHDEISDLTQELHGKAGTNNPSKAYPNNLTLGNIAEFVCLPTLVYELDYPRQESINWFYVLEKTTATFGVLCIMMVVSQAFIYPPVAKTVAMKEAGMPIEER
ncbi:acyl-CoA/sterol acyltransferase, partial [Hortaea werneckii]